MLASPPGPALLADTAPAPARAAAAAVPPWREALERLGATSIRWFPVLRLGGLDQPCLLDDSLNKLVAGGTITRDEALKHADDAKRIKG